MKPRAVEYNLEEGQFLSTIQDELYTQIETGKDILLKSGTGTGKTHVFLNNLLKRISEARGGARVIFAVPTKWLLEDLTPKGEGDINNGIAYGSGEDFYKRVQSHNIIVTTYNTALKWKEDISFIVGDEIQNVPEGVSYKKDVVKDFISIDCQKMFISATPAIVDRLPNLIHIKVNTPRKKKDIILATRKDSAEDTAKNIINNRNRNKLTVLRIQDRKLLDNIQEHFKKSVVIHKLYSEKDSILLEGQDEKAIEYIKSGEIPEDTEVLLSTSIIDAGLSLKVYKDSDWFYIDNHFFANPYSVIQGYARVREHTGFNQTMHVIGGSFGEKSLIDTQIPFADYTVDTALELMGMCWDNFEELNREDFTKVLESEGFNVKIESIESSFTGVSKKIDKVGYITIAKNLTQFPIFSEVRKVAEANNRIEDICELEGTNKLKGYSQNAHVVRVAEYIIFALSNDIQLDYFMGKQFDVKRLDDLKQSLNIVGTTQTKTAKVFKQLIFEFTDIIIAGDKRSINMDSYFNWGKNMKQAFYTVNSILNGNKSKPKKNRNLVIDARNVSNDDKVLAFRLQNGRFDK